MDNQQSNMPANNSDLDAQQTNKSTTGVPFLSDPILTAMNGVRKLFQYNEKSLIGTIGVGIVTFILMIASLIAVIFAFFAYIIHHSGGQLTFNSSIGNYINSMSDGSIYATWIFGILIFIVGLAFLQILPIALSLESVQSRIISLGMVVRTSLRRAPAILGFYILVLIALIVIAIVLAILAKFLGLLTIVLGVAVGLFLIYVIFRFSLVAYAIVDHKIGPIAAMKESWRLSRHHVVEILGVGSIIAIAIAIPEIVLIPFGQLLHETAIFQLIYSIISAIIAVIGSAAMSERFMQLRTLDSNNKPSPYPVSGRNYIVIIVAVLLGVLANAIMPKQNYYNTNQNPFPAQPSAPMYNTPDNAPTDNSNSYY